MKGVRKGGQECCPEGGPKGVGKEVGKRVRKEVRKELPRGDAQIRRAVLHFVAATALGHL